MKGRSHLGRGARVGGEHGGSGGGSIYDVEGIVCTANDPLLVDLEVLSAKPSWKKKSSLW